MVHFKVPRIPKWTKEAKEDDEFLDDGGNGADLVIVVMGATGAGKSTFINRLFGKDMARVGHSLESCSKHVKAYHLPDDEFPKNRIIVVDTPGFDDSEVLQSEIVRRISMWLAKSYTARMKIAGVVYCHNIMEDKWSGSVKKNFHLFQKLCGPAAARKTAIVTTKWDIPKKIEPLITREEELKRTYWKDMVDAGTTVHRALFTELEDDPEESKNIILRQAAREAAQDTIDSLLIKNAYYDPLQIQEELVDKNRHTYETEVGKALFSHLLDELKSHKREVGMMKIQGLQNGEEVAAVERKIKGITEDLGASAMTMTRRLRLLLASFT